MRKKTPKAKRTAAGRESYGGGCGGCEKDEGWKGTAGGRAGKEIKSRSETIKEGRGLRERRKGGERSFVSLAAKGFQEKRELDDSRRRGRHARKHTRRRRSRTTIYPPL